MSDDDDGCLGRKAAAAVHIDPPLIKNKSPQTQRSPCWLSVNEQSRVYTTV